MLSDHSDEQEQKRIGMQPHFFYQRRLDGKTASEIASHFGVSVPLRKWRLRMTGVEIQMRRSRGCGVRIDGLHIGFARSDSRHVEAVRGDADSHNAPDSLTLNRIRSSICGSPRDL